MSTFRMVYTLLFNLLCEKADDVYHGRLPVHVRCLIDEAANIGQIPNLGYAEELSNRLGFELKSYEEVAPFVSHVGHP